MKKFLKLLSKHENLTKDEIYKEIKKVKNKYLIKNDVGLNVLINQDSFEILDPELEIKVTTYDPPSGWRYGFPSIAPKSSLNQKNLYLNVLKYHQYPEKDISFALKYSKHSNRKSKLKNLPSYYFGFDQIEENELSKNIKED